MIGRVSPRGAQLRYAENGTPLCSFVLEIDEVTNGKVYTTFIPCEITGKHAEQTSIEVEPGDILQIAGKWRYKATVIDQKTGAKISKPVVSSWGASQRIPSTSPQVESSAVDPTADMSEAPTHAPEPNVRRPRYPKATKQSWTPSGLLSEN
jgi:single-stranded DNA-binding protein